MLVTAEHEVKKLPSRNSYCDQNYVPVFPIDTSCNSTFENQYTGPDYACLAEGRNRITNRCKSNQTDSCKRQKVGS
jgi:hypothetical protein